MQKGSAVFMMRVLAQKRGEIERGREIVRGGDVLCSNRLQCA